MATSTQGGQVDITEYARRLAAYAPMPLVQQLQSGRRPPPGIPQTFECATLFTDISGFTAMSEELATDGPRGAEELNRILVEMFDAMVAVIHRLGGAVGHYYGDAMLVYFADHDATAVRRALACAQHLQALVLSSFARVQANRPPHKNPLFPLTIKIGVGYGRCHAIIVGDRDTGYEYAIAGPAVAAAAGAEKRALAGQIVATRVVLAEVGLAGAAPAGQDYAQLIVPVTAVAPGTSPVIPQDEQACQELIAALRPFLPVALAERLAPAHPVSLAEHRPATSIFVQFRFRQEQQATPERYSELLHRYYRWAADKVAQFCSESMAGQQNARVNRVLTGDKGNQLHIIFGAPVAPDAPEQALRCALALQRDIPDYVEAQHIGVAAGKVYAAPLGAQNRHEYTIVGDVVNLSARLASICAPGEVLTDATTAERARAWVETSPLNPISIKGRQVKVTPHRVEHDRTLDTQLQAYFGRWDRPLIGRDHEIDAMLGFLDAALRGTGSVVAITGVAGVGKTRLLALGVRHWLEGSGIGQVGVCQQHTSDTPFAPWRNIWLRLFGITSTLPPSEQAAKIRRRILQLVPDAGKDVALWGELIGIRFPDAGELVDLPAEVRRERLFRLARRCVQAVARVQPVLIILEGVHWADQASLDLLDAISEGIENHALCCLVSYRPGQGPLLRFLEKPTAVPISMGDLAPEQARDMLEKLIGVRELPAAAERHLGLRDREGRSSPVNPLFLEEALLVMVESGVLQTDGRVTVDEARLAELPVPDNIHGLLLARLDRLPAPSRGLLQVASVIGRQFALDPLDSITPEMPRGIVVELLADLTEEELTQLVASDPEWIYLFHHAMTHEVAYESLPFARRQALHAAVADWIVDHFADNLKPFRSMLAYHYGRANIHGEGLRFALEAANEARELFANKEALELYSLAERHLQAMDSVDNWETAFEIWIERAGVQRWLGDFDRALEDAQKAHALAVRQQHAARTAQALNVLAELYYRLPDYEKAQALAQEVLRNESGTVPEQELARAYQWHGVAASRRMIFGEAIASLTEAERICLKIGDRARLARVLDGIAYVHYMQGRLEDALEAMERSAPLFSDTGMTANSASALNNVALIQTTLGRAEEALEALNQAVAMAIESSDNFHAHFLANRATVLAYLGRYEQALADFQDARTLLGSMDDQYGLVEVELLWGYEYCCAREEWDEAQHHFNVARQVIGERPEDFREHQVRLLIGTGSALVGQGEFVSAAGVLAEAERLCRAWQVRSWLPAVLLYASSAQLALGQRPHARELLTAALRSIQHEAGSADYLAPVNLNLAETATAVDERRAFLERTLDAATGRARFADRRRCLERAIALLEAMGERQSRPLLVRARHMLADLSAVAGRQR